MYLIPLRALFEGMKKRRTAYASGRREKLGLDDLLKSADRKPSTGRKKKKKDPKGRLIARTPYASKTRWRIY